MKLIDYNNHLMALSVGVYKENSMLSIKMKSLDRNERFDTMITCNPAFGFKLVSPFVPADVTIIERLPGLIPALEREGIVTKIISSEPEYSYVQIDLKALRSYDQDGTDSYLACRGIDAAQIA